MGNQNDILKRVKLLMEYDTSMTLNENILVLEQNPNAKYLDPNYTNRGNVKAGSDYFAGLQMQQKQKISMIQFCENPKNSAKCKKLKETPNVSIWEATVDNIGKDALLTAEIGKKLAINLGKGDLRGAFRDLRDFFIETYSGAFVDIFVSIAGVEVGGPLLMEALEIAFMANDLFYFLENKSGKRDSSNYTTWDGIVWQFTNNIDFQKLIVDMMVVATRGVMRNAGKALNWLKKGGKSIITTILGFVSKIKGYLPKLGVVGKFLSDKIDKITEFLNKLIKSFTEKTTQVANKSKVGAKTANKTTEKTAKTQVTHLSTRKLLRLIKSKKLVGYYKKYIRRIPKKIPEATLAGAFGMLVQAGFMISLQKFMSDPKSEDVVQGLVENDSVDKTVTETQKAVIKRCIRDTPSIKNAKKVTFAGQEGEYDIFMVDGIKYTYKDPYKEEGPGQYELIPYKTK